jgi:hypothetical protein
VVHPLKCVCAFVITLLVLRFATGRTEFVTRILAVSGTVGLTTVWWICSANACYSTKTLPVICLAW